MKRLEDFMAWYTKLRKQGYSRLMSIDCAIYNSKHYTIDGIYK